MIYTDKQRLDAIHGLPCLACDLEGRQQPNRTTAHHVVDNGYRRLSGGHQSTLPLCEWHHLGHRLPTHDNLDMAAKWGPSLALQKRRFVEAYGTERELLAMTDKKIKGAA